MINFKNVEDEEDKKMLHTIAAILDNFLNGSTEPKDRKIGFLLGIFPIGSATEFKYISNADRQNVVTLLQTMVDRYKIKTH